MNILPILKEIAGYYSMIRQVGHTTMMIDGAVVQGEDGVVVVHDQHMIACLKRMGAGVDTITLRQIANGNLRGRRQALAFDNDAIRQICLSAAEKIEDLQAEVALLKREKTETEVERIYRNNNHHEHKAPFWETDGPIGNTD